MGPTVTWYIAVAAFMFATGALGVLLRRSPLIVLLSLELMLNGGNLALIAFSRLHGNGSGQIFASVRDGRGRVGGRRRARADRGHGAAEPAAGRRQADEPARLAR